MILIIIPSVSNSGLNVDSVYTYVYTKSMKCINSCPNCGLQDWIVVLLWSHDLTSFMIMIFLELPQNRIGLRNADGRSWDGKSSINKFCLFILESVFDASVVLESMYLTWDVELRLWLNAGLMKLSECMAWYILRVAAWCSEKLKSKKIAYGEKPQPSGNITSGSKTHTS